jgi:hypothetical protein
MTSARVIPRPKISVLLHLAREALLSAQKISCANRNFLLQNFRISTPCHAKTSLKKISASFANLLHYYALPRKNFTKKNSRFLCQSSA